MMTAGYFLTVLRMWGYFRRPDVTRCSRCHRLPASLIFRKIIFSLFVVMSQKPCWKFAEYLVESI